MIDDEEKIESKKKNSKVEDYKKTVYFEKKVGDLIM